MDKALSSLLSLISTTANFDYGIVADHPTDAAFHVQQGAAVTLTRGLWSGNARDTNAGDDPSGTFNGLATMLTGAANFISSGAPDYDYHIKGISAARNQAVTSSLAVDLDNDSRVTFAPADIGVDEYAPIVLIVTPVAAGKLRLDLEAQRLAGVVDAPLHHFVYQRERCRQPGGRRITDQCRYEHQSDV